MVIATAAEIAASAANRHNAPSQRGQEHDTGKNPHSALLIAVTSAAVANASVHTDPAGTTGHRDEQRY